MTGAVLMRKSKVRADQIIARHTRVASLRVSGGSLSDISAILGVHQATISRDLVVIRQTWKTDFLESL